jgi:probable phosphoglycerate mutase
MTIGIEQGEIYVIRHAETTWNVLHRMQGQNNESLLTQKGKEESLALAQRLLPFLQGNELAIWSSDLVRAHETAKIMAHAFAVPEEAICLEPRLRECNFGQFEGSYAKDYKIHPNFSHYEKNQFLHAVDPIRGESYKTVAMRAHAALRQIKERAVNKICLVVTHGGVIRSLQMQALASDVDPVQYRDVPSTPNNAVFHLDKITGYLRKVEL